MDHNSSLINSYHDFVVPVQEFFAPQCCGVREMEVPDWAFKMSRSCAGPQLNLQNPTRVRCSTEVDVDAAAAAGERLMPQHGDRRYLENDSSTCTCMKLPRHGDGHTGFFNWDLKVPASQCMEFESNSPYLEELQDFLEFEHCSMDMPPPRCTPTFKTGLGKVPRQQTN